MVAGGSPGTVDGGAGGSTGGLLGGPLGGGCGWRTHAAPTFLPRGACPASGRYSSYFFFSCETLPLCGYYEKSRLGNCSAIARSQGLWWWGVAVGSCGGSLVGCSGLAGWWRPSAHSRGECPRRRVRVGLTGVGTKPRSRRCTAGSIENGGPWWWWTTPPRPPLSRAPHLCVLWAPCCAFDVLQVLCPPRTTATTPRAVVAKWAKTGGGPRGPRVFSRGRCSWGPPTTFADSSP